MTSTSPIYGVCVVQNEADVIRDCLLWAARFCRFIRVWDLGSTDGTWEILHSMSGEKIQPIQKQGLPYASSLRGAIAAELRGSIEEGSWIYILDADEFLVGDPAPVLAAAEQEGSSLVGVWQANFFPTLRTMADIQRLGEAAWTAQPLEARFRHYRVEWFEWRFVRMMPDLVWDTQGAYSNFRLASGEPVRKSRHALTVRHYRYRSPVQVSQRFALRQSAQEGPVRRFRYETSGSFKQQQRPRIFCREWPDPSRDLIVSPWEIRRALFRLMLTRCLRKLARMFHSITSAD